MFLKNYFLILLLLVNLVEAENRSNKKNNQQNQRHNFNAHKEGALLIIDADKNKFAENEEHLGEIIAKVDSTLFGLF